MEGNAWLSFAEAAIDAMPIPLGYLISNRCYMYMIAFFVRVALVVYSGFHDAYFEVKFTDVDYEVFTDAAKLLLDGRSVYLRHTYRYTPLLALLLVPNITVGKYFGKALFSTIDLFTGYMLEQSVGPGDVFLPSLWLFNPFVLAVSARGNADGIICFLVVATIYYLKRDSIVTSAVFFGLAVHFKLYPIIYALPLVLYLSSEGAKRHNPKETWFKRCMRTLVTGVNLKQVTFAVVSSAVFFLSSYMAYYFYGFDFLYESYLYHYIRKDHRHNFSIYFNAIYHIVDSGNPVHPLLTFVPQLVCLLGYGLLGLWDVELAIFLQTISFVSLNKVCTCQYYLWWMCLVPLVYNKLTPENFDTLTQRVVIGCFVLSNAVWLGFAYLLEMMGYNTYNMLLCASALFVTSQMAVGWETLKKVTDSTVNKPEPVKEPAATAVPTPQTVTRPRRLAKKKQ